MNQQSRLQAVICGVFVHISKCLKLKPAGGKSHSRFEKENGGGGGGEGGGQLGVKVEIILMIN